MKQAAVCALSLFFLLSSGPLSAREQENAQGILQAPLPAQKKPTQIEQREQVRPSKPQRIAVGKQALYTDQNYPRAFAIFGSLIREFPEDLDINFDYGQAAFKLGKYPNAVLAYERILTKKPELDRVRLELGLSYLAMEKWDKSKKELEQVLQNNPPETVQKNIHVALKQIQRKSNKWTTNISVAFSHFYDDNANSGLNVSAVALNGVSFDISGSSQSLRDSGETITFSLSSSYKEDKKSPLSWNFGIISLQKWYNENSELDLTYNRVHVGPQYISGRSIVGFLVKFEDIDFDYHDLTDMWGGELSILSMITPSLIMNTKINLEERDHRQDNDQTSKYLKAAQDAIFTFGKNKHKLTLSAQFEEERAPRSKKNSTISWQLSGKVDWNVSKNFKPYFSYTWSDKHYQAPSTSLAGNLDREDDQNKYSFGFKRPFFRDDMTLDIKYEYTNNFSNTAIHKYKRRAITATVTYNF